MRWNYRKKAGTFSAAEDGVVTVELVILFPVLMLIIVGIVEFGHLFYVRHTLTNASREGARAAVVYTTGDRKTYAETTAKAAVVKYLADTKFGGTVPPATVEAGTKSGDVVKVTVTSNTGLLLLDKLVPAIGARLNSVSAETTMRME
jgi:Flp pilus assembly protein TadG